eukprot:2080600-Prymnesium_polylepis.1
MPVKKVVEHVLGSFGMLSFPENEVDRPMVTTGIVRQTCERQVRNRSAQVTCASGLARAPGLAPVSEMV